MSATLTAIWWSYAPRWRSDGIFPQFTVAGFKSTKQFVFQIHFLFDDFRQRLKLREP